MAIQVHPLRADSLLSHCLNTMKILIVDDQKTTGLALSQILEAHGHDTRLITSGADAWDAITSEDWRLILTDWVMPDMDGLELCRRIRGRVGDPYRYVIMVTAHSERTQRLEGLEAGADDFLTKPVDEEELLVRLAIARRILAVQADLEEKNRCLAELADTDPLTGLANRRRLTRITGGRPADGPLSSLSVVSLDIDHFKSYNDKFGHTAGDKVLRIVSRLLRSGTRPDDLVARTGGEEFVIVMPRTGSDEAVAIAERLRCSIAEFQWPLRKVTASLGVATVRGPLSSVSYSVALEAADRAVYGSKAAGRNRVTPASSHGAGEIGAAVQPVSSSVRAV
jgi:two-component system chemotaxis response regulator CheY